MFYLYYILIPSYWYVYYINDHENNDNAYKISNACKLRNKHN